MAKEFSVSAAKSGAYLYPIKVRAHPDNIPVVITSR
jgi:hypothetical protein